MNIKKSHLPYRQLPPTVELTRCGVVIIRFILLFEGVALEDGLGAALSQEQFVLLEAVGELLVLLCWQVSHLLEVVLGVGFEGGLQCSVEELVPREIFEPTVLF